MSLKLLYRTLSPRPAVLGVGEPLVRHVDGRHNLVELGRQVADVANQLCVGMSKARRHVPPAADVAAGTLKVFAKSSKFFLIFVFISSSSSRSLRPGALSSSAIC